MRYILKSLLSVFAQNPFVIIYFIGIAIAWFKLWDEHRKAAWFMISGCLICIVTAFSRALVTDYLFSLELSNAEQMKMHIMAGYVHAGLTAVGIILIMLAAVVGREDSSVESNSIRHQTIT